MGGFSAALTRQCQTTRQSRNRFYDRVIFPVVHRLESMLLRPPIGQRPPGRGDCGIEWAFSRNRTQDRIQGERASRCLQWGSRVADDSSLQKLGKEQLHGNDCYSVNGFC